jgi:serine/threonine-protein kinase
MARDPAQRFESAAEMIHALEDILEGKVKVQCHVTMTKRLTRELGRFVDRRPTLSFTVLALTALGIAGGLVFAAVTLVRAVLA